MSYIYYMKFKFVLRLQVFFGIMTALGNFGMVGALISTFGSARGAGAQIFRLLDNVPSINPLQDRGVKPVLCEGSVDLHEVVFHYPSRPDVKVSSFGPTAYT